MVERNALLYPVHGFLNPELRFFDLERCDKNYRFVRGVGISRTPYTDDDFAFVEFYMDGLGIHDVVRTTGTNIGESDRRMTTILTLDNSVLLSRINCRGYLSSEPETSDQYYLDHLFLDIEPEYHAIFGVPTDLDNLIEYSKKYTPAIKIAFPNMNDSNEDNIFADLTYGTRSYKISLIGGNIDLSLERKSNKDSIPEEFTLTDEQIIEMYKTASTLIIRFINHTLACIRSGDLQNIVKTVADPNILPPHL